jgi:hypothetical protein
MTKEVKNCVTILRSLIELPLRRLPAGTQVPFGVLFSIHHSASPSSFFFPNERSGASLQFQALIASNSAIEYIQTNKEGYHLSSPPQAEDRAYSPLTIHHSLL